MYRKAPFIENEHYHIYSRGEKRKFFLIQKTITVLWLLYIMNQNISFRMDNFCVMEKKTWEKFSKRKGGNFSVNSRLLSYAKSFSYNFI